MNTRVRLLASLTVAGLGLFAPAAHAQTVTFRAVYNETLRGGLTTDGWGGLSSPTTYATGAFHIRLPRGARVVWARLLTDVVMRPQDVMTATVPAGPTGFPREVILGGTNGAVTRSLEGRPDYVRTVSFTYGTFSTDVTDAVQMLVGSVAPGGEVEIPIRERGDEGPSNGSVSQAPVFEGHGLAVVYALDYGPRRNVTVYEGNAAGNVRVTDLPLRSPVANRCPTSSLRGEAFPLSLMLASEYSVCQEDNPLTINGTRVSSTVGGADDWPNDPRTGCNGSIAGLVTVGSFGGGEASEGAAAGAPVGLEGDSVTGPPPAPRLDDELYDARTFLADGVTRMDFNFGGNGDEVVFGIGLQSLARDQMTDADDDGFTDEAEGDCGTDTDRDGTPDYLDLDADNDCLPDRMETASGRIDPAMPGPADANCVGGAPVCDRAVGVCGCRTNSDCPAAAPVCDPRARFCSACTTSGQCAGRVGFTVCATGGAREGQCVECTESGQCAGAQRVCDTAANVCVGCLSDNDCTGATPRCDTTMRVCVALPDAGSPDAGVVDAGPPDAGVMDAGVMDAGLLDAGVADAGALDVGVADAGVIDTGALDAGQDGGGVVDVPAMETAVADTGSDTGPVDSGATDAGNVQDAPADAGPAETDAGDAMGVQGGGCGCHTHNTSPRGWSLAALLGLVTLARRRRRSDRGPRHSV
jgi:MYXO-CTERM domain-containing protein